MLITVNASDRPEFALSFIFTWINYVTKLTLFFIRDQWDLVDHPDLPENQEVM